MNLQEILKRKREEKQEEEVSNLSFVSPSLISKEEAEKAALVFFILFTKFYSRDKRIGYGPAFLLLKDFLLEGYTFNEKDYPEKDIGFSISHEYMFQMLYKIPPNVLYTLYKKFLIDKKSEKCENCFS